jgi:hypothetical protein
LRSRNRALSALCAQMTFAFVDLQGWHRVCSAEY